MDIKTLIAVATGKIPHNYRSGICPDELQPDSRDPDCPACKILIEAEHDKIGRPAAYIEEMERELRAAEIRLHDVAAHCANVEAELAEIKPAKPATAQVQLNDSEMEMIARAHGTGGWQTLDDMVRFARAIEAAVLRANGFDIQPPEKWGLIPPPTKPTGAV